MCNYAQKLEEMHQYGGSKDSKSGFVQHWILGFKIWINE